MASGHPRKRVYGSWGQFFGDIWLLTKDVVRVLRILKGGLVPPSFRERLMLAVTEVYGCTHCSWHHTREALKSGVEQEEINRLLAGSVENCPKDEVIAVIYAQHWADSDAKPDPESVQRLGQVYGTEKAEVINLVLRMVRVGNLSHNSWNRFLHRVSFGRWGA